MKIHGIVISRDDWGQLAVSISHALLHHVDVVHVLDHGSVDQTASGLQLLKSAWKDRLRIYSAGPDLPFRQAVLVNMLTSVAENEGADWIYAFDSDEFLLTKPALPLRQMLEKLDDSIVRIQYTVSNYISTFDFDRLNLDGYANLKYKSQPSTNYDFERAFKEIYEEKSTFFDFPFPPKVIFRAQSNQLIKDGNHGTAWLLPGQAGVKMPAIECAHLTYISKDILERKRVLGEGQIKLQQPAGHGWQSRLIYQLHQEGRLDRFWERHSINTQDAGSASVKHITDESLVQLLAPSLDLLKKLFGGASLGAQHGVPLKHGCSAATTLSFGDAYRLCESFEAKIRRLTDAPSELK